MPSTVPAPQAACSASLTVSPQSLAAAFTCVPDPRRAASVASPLAAVLSLAVVAILANHPSVLAIAPWGARQPAERLRSLGFAAGRGPCQSTLHRLCGKLDGRALAALRAHFGPVAVPLPAPAGGQGVAVDGKAQRGRLPFPRGGCPVHALTACCHERGVVLAQEPIAQGADKGEGELRVAPALLARVAWHGRVLTGDALCCQRGLCQQVLDAGGDSLLVVKDNQPALHEALALLFDPPPALAPAVLADRRLARTCDRGHGRLAAVRELVASTDLTGSLDWPGLGQVFRLERTWQERGVAKRALRHGITSLRPEAGPPERLLALKRCHWGIEHGLHRVKDLALGEDRSTVHRGQGPTVLAFLRDAAVSLLRRAGVRQISARLRDHSQDPGPALALVHAAPPDAPRA